MSAQQQPLPLNRAGSHDARFAAWARQNPHIVDAFEAFALELVRAGRRRIGAKLILERLRWETLTRTVDARDFKINNDHGARLARLVAQRHPELRDVFSFRAMPTSDAA